MDPAGMMIGMAVGSVMGKQMAGTINNVMQDAQQKVNPPAPSQAVPPPPQYQNQKERTVHIYDEKNFYSMDRLLKFGLTTNVAEQMVNSMNHSITNMIVPGAGNQMKQTQGMQMPGMQMPGMQPQQQELYVIPDIVYYAVVDGKQAGPFCETELARLINDGKLTNDTLVWHTGLGEWTRAENVPTIIRLVAIAPPPLPPGALIPPLPTA